MKTTLKELDKTENNSTHRRVGQKLRNEETTRGRILAQPGENPFSYSFHVFTDRETCCTKLHLLNATSVTPGNKKKHLVLNVQTATV